MRVLMILICIFQVAMFAPQKDYKLTRGEYLIRLGYVQISPGIYRFYWADNVERNWEDGKKFCDEVEGDYTIATFETSEQIEILRTASISKPNFSGVYWIAATLGDVPGSMKWPNGGGVNSLGSMEWKLEDHSGVCGAYYSHLTTPYFQVITCSTQHQVICQEDLPLPPL